MLPKGVPCTLVGGPVTSRSSLGGRYAVDVIDPLRQLPRKPSCSIGEVSSHGHNAAPEMASFRRNQEGSQT